MYQTDCTTLGNIAYLKPSLKSDISHANGFNYTKFKFLTIATMSASGLKIKVHVAQITETTQQPFSQIKNNLPQEMKPAQQDNE